CPDALAAQTSGRLYLGACRSNQLGVVHADGSITLLKGPQDIYYGLLRPGPHGSILIADELYRNDLQRMTPAGRLVDGPLPDTGSTVTDAVVGADGRIWFT